MERTEPASGTTAGMANKGQGREKVKGVPLSEEEEVLIADAAKLGGENVAGFMRRVSLTEARRLLGKGGAQ